MGNYSFRPIIIREAKRFMKEHHRHNDPAQGGKFAVSVVDEQGHLVGVGLAGRPVNYQLAKEGALEITRVCVLPGNKNVSSMIYACLRRIGKEMGYKKIITYTLTSESGVSLRALGAVPVAVVKGKPWNSKGRPRREQAIYYEIKIRWEL